MTDMPRADKIAGKVMLTANEVCQTIENAIQIQRPLSLIRLGDGEARLLGYPEYLTAEEIDRSLLIWYGKYRTRQAEDMRPLKAQVIKASQNADILGVPTRRSKNSMHKLLIENLVKRYSLVQHEITNCKVCREIQRIGQWTRLISGKAKVSVITCWEQVQASIKELGVKEVQWYPVPPEAKYTAPTEQHYPYRHNQLVEELRADVQQGDLFFVGAGPNGKVYCDVIKQQGGIGIDVGSVMDGWGKVAVRPWLKKNPEAYRL